jgi:putative hydrolase of the HAD superfamily
MISSKGAFAKNTSQAGEGETVLTAVTFDLWSTLWDDDGEITRHQIRTSRIEDILRARGHEPPEGAIRSALEACGQRGKAVRAQGHRDFPPEEQVPFILGILGIEADPGLVDAVMEPYINTLLVEAPAVLPGAREALRAVSQVYRVGLISNTGVSPGISIRKVLESQGLKGFFSGLTFSNEVSWVKPHPAIFKDALEQLGASPQEAVHVGDDPFADVAGAQRFGMKAIRYGSFDPEAEASILDYGNIMEVLVALS